MEALAVFGMIAYIAIAVFLISLAIRFVKAVEQISSSIGKIADKSD